MGLKKKWGLLPLMLVLGLLFSGCGLFNDVDLDDVLPEELSRADFLNTLVNDFEAIVQSFIEQTEYDDTEGWSFPEEEDIDFSDFLAHFDILMYYFEELVDEEEFIEELLYDLEYFLTDSLLPMADLDTEDFNDAEITFALQYKYFFEIPIFFLGDNEYPQEPVEFLVAAAIRTITVDGEKFEEIFNSLVVIADFEDHLKAALFEYWNFLGEYYNGIM